MSICKNYSAEMKKMTIFYPFRGKKPSHRFPGRNIFLSIVISLKKKPFSYDLNQYFSFKTKVYSAVAHCSWVEVEAHQGNHTCPIVVVVCKVVRKVVLQRYRYIQQEENVHLQGCHIERNVRLHARMGLFPWWYGFWQMGDSNLVVSG